MKTFMLDSMIFDKLIINDKIKRIIIDLKRNNKIRILTTHIQFDELNATPDMVKKMKLVGCAEEICECVPTMGAVIGITKVGQARVNNGETIRKIRQNNLKRTRDSLISSTASSDADFLVTGDISFANRVKRNLKKITVLNYDEFIRILKAF